MNIKIKIGFISVSDYVDPLMVEETIPSGFQVVAESLDLDKRVCLGTPSVLCADQIYATSLRGEEMVISKTFLAEALSLKIQSLEKHVDMIVLGCSGAFEKFKASVPILYPGKLLWGIVRAMSLKSIVTFVPHYGQQETVVKNWRFLIPEVSAYVVCPAKQNIPDDLPKVSIVLDCMEYSDSFKRKIQKHTGQPVFLARGIVRAALLSL